MASAQEPRLLVVTPAWNEEECLAATVVAIREVVPAAVIVVIDDGSTDRTGERARAAGARVLTLPFNLGVGAAMRTGFRFAEQHDFDAVVQVDADGQHDPRDIGKIIAALAVPPEADGCDVVVGARQFRATGSRVRGPRRWAMVLLARSLSRLTGTKLSDVTSGFRAANRRAITVYARHYPAEYLGDTVESLVIGSRCGLRIGQVPVGLGPRRGGRPSQRPLGASLYLARALLVLLLSRIRRWPGVTEPDNGGGVR